MARAQKTPISVLQEVMVAKQQIIPTYTFESIGTLFEPMFSCTVNAGQLVGTAEARNKKEAKQEAAKNALLKLNNETIMKMCAIRSNTLEESPLDFVVNKNYIGILNEFASHAGINYPTYEESVCLENGKFKCVCRLENLEGTGYGPNKKTAKQIASYHVASNLKSLVKGRKIELPKKQPLELNDKDMDVLRKFDKLTLAEKSTVERSSRDHIGSYNACKDIKVKKYTTEEAKNELVNLKLEFLAEVLQTDPYLVSLRLIDKDVCEIAGGSTKEEATTEAFNKVLNVLREGSASVSLIS